MDNMIVDELQVQYGQLLQLATKLSKRNKELKDALKEVFLENEALEQKVASMEIEVASLQEERKANSSLKEDLARQQEEHTMLLKENEDLTKEMESLKASQPAISTKEDPSLERIQAQPSTSTSQTCHACGNIGHIAIMCKVKNLLSNGECRWVRKELDNTRRETSTCPRISVFKRLGPRTFSTDYRNGLKMSQKSRMKKEGRTGVYKQKNGPKRHDHPSTLKTPSSKRQNIAKAPMRKRSKAKRNIKIKERTHREEPKF